MLGGMSLLTLPRVAKWPFLLGDALMLGLAWFFYTQAKLPFNGPTLFACVACVAIGAVLGITPFIMDYRAAVRLAESEGLASTVSQIRELEKVAAAISQATSQWQAVQEHATQTAEAARTVSEQMASEMKSFTEFLARADQSEKQHLALEVDKLKRAEGEWLGVLVRILDHVYALHAAALRSGQPKVIDQLNHFQLAVRDTARRVGLVPFEAEPGSEFDPEKHTLPEEAEASQGARVGAVLACGYNFRGRMLRPALVQLQEDQVGDPATEPPTVPAPEQSADPAVPREQTPPPGTAATEQDLAL